EAAKLAKAWLGGWRGHHRGGSATTKKRTSRASRLRGGNEDVTFLEAFDLEVVVGGGGRCLGGSRWGLGACGRRGLWRCCCRPGGRSLAAGWRLRLFLGALEVVPRRIRSRADARDAQREVVRVRALPQRLFIGDDVLL